jgi:hypothetical protein
MLRFSILLFLVFILPVAVVGAVLLVVHHYRDNRKYLEYEEEVYEGRAADVDMPEEPYERDPGPERRDPIGR